MKKNFTIAIFLLAVLIILFASCKAVKDLTCISKKSVPVTFITKSGKFFTLQLPYCDTVQLTKESIPDSVEVITILKAKQ